MRLLPTAMAATVESSLFGSDLTASQLWAPLDRPLTIGTEIRKMVRNESKSGFMHRIPSDLREAIGSEATTQTAWEDLTPLARNEWICWVTSAKQEATRNRRIQRALEKLKAGEHRPCCWPGCPHRRASARKWFERRAQRP